MLHFLASCLFETTPKSMFHSTINFFVLSQGITCNDDVNECAIISGTEDECQNGGTCVNNRGSYM